MNRKTNRTKLCFLMISTCLALTALGQAGESNCSLSTAWGQLEADSALYVITPENANLVSGYRILNGHTDGVWSVTFSPDGSLLASGAQDRTVRLWNMETFELARTLPNHNYRVIGLAFSLDGQTVATGEATLFQPVSVWTRLWSAADGSSVGGFASHTGGVWSLAYRQGTNILASCGLDRLIKYWDLGTSQPVDTLVGHTDAVLCIAFSPDQTLIASSSIDRTVRIWDAATGAPLHVLTGHTNNIGFVTFSPDGATLVSSADDGTIRYWRVSDGQSLRIVNAQQSWVNGLAFSPDGRVLVSTGHNGSVRLWDPASGGLLRALSGHTQPVIRVAFSPNGKLIATASWDRTVRLWGVYGPLDPDPDLDVILWPADNCFGTYNPDQLDADFDQIGDVCDLCTDVDRDGFANPGYPAGTCPVDNCPSLSNPGQSDQDNDGVGDVCDNCRFVGNADQLDSDENCPAFPYTSDPKCGDACRGCCVGRVGDANGSDEPEDEIALGDIMLLIDVKFISGDCSKLPCIAEADVNQDGGTAPTCEEHVTLGDIMTLVDFLFITGPENATLAECL